MPEATPAQPPGATRLRLGFLTRLEVGADAADSYRFALDMFMAAEELGQQTVCLTVFVCTGNTCRSPLAEALFKRKLADRLGCTAEELPKP